MANLLEITVSDIESEINPLGLSILTEIGEGGVAEAKVQDIADRVVAVVLSTPPETYRKLFRRVEGEKVVTDAVAGQTEIQLGLFPVVGDSVQLFVDWDNSRGSEVVNAGDLEGLSVNSTAGAYNPDFGQPGARPYRARRRQDALASTAYTVDEETGLVTLAAGHELAINRTVHADYNHTAMSKCHMLRHVALALIVSKLREILPMVGGDQSDRIEREERRATAILVSISEGTAGIDFFDELKLEDETRTADRTPKKRLRLPF